MAFFKDELQELIDKKRHDDPKFEKLYQEATERDKRLVESECAYGNCTDLRDPEDPEYFASIGPISCPCKEGREL